MAIRTYFFNLELFLNTVRNFIRAKNIIIPPSISLVPGGNKTTLSTTFSLLWTRSHPKIKVPPAKVSATA